MTNPFKESKEIVMSAVVLMIAGTFCYLAIIGSVDVQMVKEIFIFIFGVYTGGKYALAGGNSKPGNGK
jgi:hypothetical protein